MQTVNIYAAKAHLSRLVDAAANGDEIVIARAGKPVARLMPLAAPEKKCVLWTMPGMFNMPGDFDAPLPDGLLDMFEGR